jgi:hypothetical protein
MKIIVNNIIKSKKETKKACLYIYFIINFVNIIVIYRGLFWVVVVVVVVIIFISSRMDFI